MRILFTISKYGKIEGNKGPFSGVRGRSGGKFRGLCFWSRRGGDGWVLTPPNFGGGQYGPLTSQGGAGFDKGKWGGGLDPLRSRRDPQFFFNFSFWRLAAETWAFLAIFCPTNAKNGIFGRFWGGGQNLSTQHSLCTGLKISHPDCAIV